MTITREKLNELYCTFYSIPNDGLKIHTQDKVHYTKGKRSVLLIDEMNRAATDILNASLQLILDKRLNDHVLPIVDGKPTFVGAAINPADQDYTVNTFDPALLDRFVMATIEPDVGAWLDWARANNVAPIVRDFLAEHPDRLHFTDEKDGITATPRSWASLGRTMDNVDRIAPEILHSLMKGHLGTALSSQFLMYFNNYFKVIKLADVEKFITTKSKATKDIEKLGAQVNKLLASQEVIQKQELATQFYDKYIQFETAEEARPLLAMLYSLDIEILNGFLKSKSSADTTNYNKLAKFDGEINNKALFKRIIAKTQA